MATNTTVLIVVTALAALALAGMLVPRLRFLASCRYGSGKGCGKPFTGAFS